MAIDNYPFSNRDVAAAVATKFPVYKDGSNSDPPAAPGGYQIPTGCGGPSEYPCGCFVTTYAGGQKKVFFGHGGTTEQMAEALEDRDCSRCNQRLTAPAEFTGVVRVDRQ